MRNLTFLSLCLLLTASFLSSCKKDCSGDPTPFNGENIRFDNMAVGQSARYLGLFGENYFMPTTNDYSYTNDTLVLRVIGEDANGFKVAESLHYVGDVHPWMAGDKDSIYIYYLKVENDSLRAKPIGSDGPGSRIFNYNIWNWGLPLKDISSQEVEISGWKTTFGYCECRQEGYAEDVTLFYQTYSGRSNVIVENSAMAWDGAGETYVFSKKHGILRFSSYGWWTQSGYGWDLLPTE